MKKYKIKIPYVKDPCCPLQRAGELEIEACYENCGGRSLKIFISVTTPDGARLEASAKQGPALRDRYTPRGLRRHEVKAQALKQINQRLEAVGRPERLTA